MTDTSKAPDRIWVSIGYETGDLLTGECSTDPSKLYGGKSGLSEYIHNTPEAMAAAGYVPVDQVVTVKPLKFNQETGSRWAAISQIGTYVVSKEDGAWGWMLDETGDFGIVDGDEREAIAFAQADYDQRILSGIITQPVSDVAGEALPEHPILERAFAIQYNPNCPSPWLIRLIGPNSSFIDLKPYSVFTSVDDMTHDILGFGVTFEEAATKALSAIGGE